MVYDVLQVIALRVHNMAPTLISKDRYEKGHHVCTFQCQCGALFQARLNNVQTGNTTGCKACGYAKRNAKKRQHGHAPYKRPSRTYSSWAGMIARCTNPNDRNWTRYGGRGIDVDPRWMEFANFLTDMGERPANTSIDRIDNDGPYTQKNCRWATAKQQADNRTNTIALTVGDETRCLSDWLEIYPQHPRKRVLKRLQLGWTAHDALTKPRR